MRQVTFGAEAFLEVHDHEKGYCSSREDEDCDELKATVELKMEIPEEKIGPYLQVSPEALRGEVSALTPINTDLISLIVGYALEVSDTSSLMHKTWEHRSCTAYVNIYGSGYCRISPSTLKIGKVWLESFQSGGNGPEVSTKAVKNPKRTKRKQRKRFPSRVWKKNFGYYSANIRAIEDALQEEQEMTVSIVGTRNAKTLGDGQQREK